MIAPSEPVACKFSECLLLEHVLLYWAGFNMHGRCCHQGKHKSTEYTAICAGKVERILRRQKGTRTLCRQKGNAICAESKYYITLCASKTVIKHERTYHMHRCSYDNAYEQMFWPSLGSNPILVGKTWSCEQRVSRRMFWESFKPWLFLLREKATV